MTNSLEKLKRLDGLVDQFIQEYGKSKDQKEILSKNIQDFVGDLSKFGGDEITRWKDLKRREGITPLFDDVVELQGLIKERITQVVDENKATEQKIDVMYQQLLEVVGSTEAGKTGTSLPVTEPVPLTSTPITSTSVPANSLPEVNTTPPLKSQTQVGDPHFDVDRFVEEQKLKISEGTGGRKTLRKSNRKRRRKSYRLASSH